MLEYAEIYETISEELGDIEAVDNIMSDFYDWFSIRLLLWGVCADEWYQEMMKEENLKIEYLTEDE